MLGILQQNKKLSSHTLMKDPNFESKNWEKRTKKCQNLEGFPNLKIR